MIPLTQPSGTTFTNGITSANNPINDVVTLYSPLDFKTHVFNTTIDDTAIKQAIFSVETTKLQQILGDTIYEDFLNEFAIAGKNPKLLTDGSNTVKGINYRKLWTVCLMFVVKCVEYELMVSLTYPLTPSGIKQQINNNTFATEPADFKFRFTAQIEMIEKEKSKLMQYVSDKIAAKTEPPCDKMSYKRTFGLFRIGKT